MNPELAGTQVCPVCGRATPHFHDVEVVNAARSRLAQEMGLGEIAAEVVRSARPTHGDAAMLSRDLVRRLSLLLEIPATAFGADFGGFTPGGEWLGSAPRGTGESSAKKEKK